MSDFKLQLGLNSCSNPEYHGDKGWLSSSSLKKLLKSPAAFYAELTEPHSEVENPNFTIGSFLHSLILEPELIHKEYAMYSGMRKAGKEFETFKEQNKGKTIISRSQKGQCEMLKKAFEANPLAVNLLKNTEKEFTICVLLNEVPIKVRFDAINLVDSYGLDLKTSSFGVDKDSFKMTMGQFGYGLSAALYSWAAEIHFGRPFDFYMIPIAKQDLDCQVYRMSQDTIMRGRAEITRALDIYKKCKQTGVWPEVITLESRLQTEIEEI